jgi:hypothetical protein
MAGKARDILRRFTQSIQQDKAMGEQEMKTTVAFLEGTRLPILRMLYVNLALTKGIAPLHVDKYAEVIAYDILYEYLMGILNNLIAEARKLNLKQFDSELFDSFLKNLQLVKQEVRNRRNDLYKKEQLQVKFVDEVRVLEQQLASSIDVGEI